MDMSSFLLASKFALNDHTPLQIEAPKIPETESLEYENTIFKEMADDIKSPLEHQLRSIEIIAENAKKQAESSKTIATASKEQAYSAVEQVHILQEQLLLAKQEIKSADRQADISTKISIAAIVVSVLAFIVPLLF